MSTSSAKHLRLVTLSTNLPAAPRGRLRGRRAELAALQRWLGAEGGVRVRALVGPPGVGKSRLATALAQSVVEAGGVEWRGCWFVDLSAARTTSDVVDALAVALGAALPPFAAHLEAARALERHLEAEGHVLVVADNLEQIDDEAAAWLASLPERNPRLWLLATTRRQDRFVAEQRQALGPLSLPDDAKRGPAWHLFVDRARRLTGSFEPDARQSKVIARIVSQLEGLPLAIELAAARLFILSPEEIAARLDRLDELLDVPVEAGTASLRIALEGSWALLDDAARRVFAAMSVFGGPFGVAAAEAVLAEPGETGLLHALQSLAMASLVEVDDAATRRFRLLPPLAAFAGAQQASVLGADAVEAIRVRHARWFAGRARELCAALETDPGRTALDALAGALDDLKAVVVYATDHPDPSPELLDAAVACAIAVDAISRRGAGATAAHALVLGLLDRIGAGERCAVAGHVELLTAAWRMLRTRRDTLARRDALVELAVARARSTGEADPASLGRALHAQIVHIWSGRRREDALALCSEALEVAERSGDRALQARLGVAQAWLLNDSGKLDEAVRRVRQCVARLEACEAHHEVCVASANLAVLYYQIGALDAAVDLSRRLLARCRALGDLTLEARVLQSLTAVEILVDADGFEAHCEAALALADRLDDGELQLKSLTHRAWHQAFVGGDDGQALLALQSIVSRRRAAGNARLLAYDLQSLAELHALRGEPAAARTCLDEALGIAHDIGNRVQIVVATSLRASLEPGGWHAAEALIEAARRRDDISDEKLSLGVALESVVVDARHERLADAPGADARTDAAIDTLVRALRPAPPPLGLPGRHHPFARRSRYMRAATRRAMTALPEPLRAHVWARALDADQAALCAAGDGVRFRLPGGQWLDLSSNTTLARVLDALVAHRRAGHFTPLSFDVCIEAGWPGEAILYEAAVNRLHQTISRLRRKGLRGVLHNHDGGYRIEPEVAVVGPADL